MEQNNFPEQTAPVRSGSLSALAILGMVANGLWALIMAIVLANPDEVLKGANLRSDMEGMVVAMLGIGIVLLILKFWGCLTMYQMKKWGYVLYLIPNIIISFIFLLGYISQPATIGANGATMFVFALWVGSIIFMVMLGKEMKKLNPPPTM